MNPGSSLCWSLDHRSELGLRLRKGHSPACTAAGEAPGTWRSSVWPGRSGGEEPGPGGQIVAQLESGLLQRHTMDASGGKERIKWTTTIIISSSLKTYEIATALENRSHRVRYSDTLERGSIVFSLSVWGPRSDSAYENSPFLGAAFLLMDAKECMISAEEIFLTKIDKFINMHQNSFLVLFAPLHGPEEWNLMFRIHQRFLGSNLRILPVHNTVNAVDLMCTIAKTTSKPTIDSICYRMITTKAYIIEQSPVWRTLQKIKLSTDSGSPNSEY